MKNLRILVFLILGAFTQSAYAQELQELLQRAYGSNSELKSALEHSKAQKNLVASKATLDDPMLGISTLDRGNETKYGVISQKVRFPVKYYLQASVQKNTAKAAHANYVAMKFELRKKLVNLYYAIFSQQRIIQLTEANMESVREFARVAEKRYAAGKATQANSMKSHFELTQLELDLMRFRQQESALQDRLKSLLQDFSYPGLKFSKKELPVPHAELVEVSRSTREITSELQKHSPKLKVEAHKLEALDQKSDLAKWEFAPDFQLQYQTRLSGQPEDSEIIMVSMSFPLWFWKKGSEASAASAQRKAQEYKLQSVQDTLLARVKDLTSQVEVGAKTLRIYKTSLIPQAQGAFNSSKAAYRASKTRFLDLLDSERSLYRVKTGYYKNLRQYVENLAELESELGFEVSNLTHIKGDPNAK